MKPGTWKQRQKSQKARTSKRKQDKTAPEGKTKCHQHQGSAGLVPNLILTLCLTIKPEQI